MGTVRPGAWEPGGVGTQAVASITLLLSIGSLLACGFFAYVTASDPTRQNSSGRFTLWLMIADCVYALSWIVWSLGRLTTNASMPTMVWDHGGVLDCSATAFNTAGLAGIILSITMLLAHGVYVTARRRVATHKFQMLSYGIMCASSLGAGSARAYSAWPAATRTSPDTQTGRTPRTQRATSSGRCWARAAPPS